MDINKEIENIIEMYQLDRHYPAYRTSKAAINYMQKFVHKLSESGQRHLFICTSKKAKRMIDSWHLNDLVRSVYIFHLEELNEYLLAMENVDSLYVVSRSREIEILHWIWRHGLEAKSVYDILEEHNIYAPMEFCDFFHPIKLSKELNLEIVSQLNNEEGTALTLYEYYYQKQRLQHCITAESRKRLTEKLFFLALCMRNFLEVERIVGLMPENKEFNKAWEDIERLLDRIKKECNDKDYNNIIIFWLDALGYDNAQKMEYLQRQREHSVYFENAFTVTPYTRPTFNAIFRGIKQIDDKGYKERYIGEENSFLINDILEHGYDFGIISSDEKDIDKKYSIYSRIVEERLLPCSEIYWDMLSQILNKDKPGVYVAHALVEMHGPKLSVRRNNFEKDYENTEEVRKLQLAELNDQLCFYDNLLGRNDYRIYMCDHGGNPGGCCNNVHVLLQVYYTKWKKDIIKKPFSYLDLHKVLNRLLEGKEIDDSVCERKYVPIQDVDFYNYDYLRSWLKNKGLDTLPFLMAYRGVANAEYIYLRFKTGDELLHRWEDGEYIPSIGMSNKEKDTELFANLRKEAGEFPDILDTDSQFRFAANTYNLYYALKQTVQSAVDLLDKRLEKYADGSVFLLGDEYHSRQLLAVLSENSRKKVGGGYTN